MSNTSEPPSADPSSGGPSHGREGGGAAAGPQAPWEPIFSTPGSDIVPGELLLTLTPPATQALTRSIPLHPLGPATAGVAELGVGELDEVLADLGVRDVVRMALPSTGIAGALDQPATGRLQEADEPLSRSFRVRVATDTELEAAAERLRGLGAVENAEPNRYRETLAVPNDPEYGQQWGLPKINAPAAWDRTTGDSTVVVAVIDSGCDLDHPELAPLLVPGYDMVDLGTNPTPPAGFVFEGDFSGRDDVPEDEVGHGTHVAGTIAALSNNAAGVAGVTWNCRIMPVKALTRIRRIAEPPVVVRGVGSSADVAAAVRWAADHGASVINMSLGSPSPTSLEQSAVAYAIGKGCVVVAAMGNTGTSDPSYPAAYPDVVSVGAIDSADARASFSQTGGHIDVVAPGVGIRSTYLDGGFATLNGTSMASPHVAGVAALIRSVKPTATVAEVTDILRTTARPLRDAPADPVPNDRYGHGCVDAQAAVSKAAPIVLPPLTVFAPCFPRTPFTPCLPRTPILPCLPRTPFAPCLEIRTPLLPCPTIPTTFPPTTFPPTTTFPPPTLPTTFPPPTLPTTFPPTFPPTTPPPTGPFGPGQGGAGGAYDPFGMTGYQAAYGTGAAGGQAGSAAGGVTGVGATGPGAGAAGGTGAAGPAAGASAGGGQESYEAGYAAGYAAAYAEMAGGGGTAAGPGTAEIAPSVLCPIITRPFPIRTPLLPCLPDTVLLRDCWFPRSPLWRCPPPTVLEPHCFEVTPPTQTFPTTPITNPGGPGGPGGFGGGYGGYGGGYGGYGYGGYGGGGYGGDGGYDPYGRSPFGA